MTEVTGVESNAVSSSLSFGLSIGVKLLMVSVVGTVRITATRLASSPQRAMSRTSAIMAAALLATGVARVHAQQLPDAATIRTELTAVNAAWSRIRLAYDRPAAEALLMPDFYAALRDARITRDEFLTRISTRSPAKLVRFDNPILTIIKGDSANEWVALVMEKIEYERVAADGSVSRTYHLWVTRDGFKRLDAGTWRIMYTQEVMREVWGSGAKPPFPDWDRPGPR